VLWGGLGFVVLAMILLGLLARAQQRRDQGYPGRLTAADCAWLIAEAQELDAIATSVFDAAHRAAEGSIRAAAELAVAEAERDAAWQAHGATARALDEASTAEDQPPAQSMSDPDQREISRAAREAYRRGELSVDELRAVWHRVDGWDQSLQDRANELSRLRADKAEAWRRYHAAAFIERSARRAAEVAQVAAAALAQEAADASEDAQVAHMAAQECSRRRSTR
jgi:hypothetical protein